MATLRDKIYGEMNWDDESFCWVTFIENVPNEEFQVCIYAETPLDFLAVRNTHQTYERLIGEISRIRHWAMREIIENNNRISSKKRERKVMANIIEKELKLGYIEIFDDLSAEVYFDSDIFVEGELIKVVIGANGEFLKAVVTEDF